MSELRTNICGGNNERGNVTIDTNRVLDSCRDRDCFENARVYLTASGEQALAAANNIRTVSSSILYAYVGVDEVPFNCGFYRVSVCYYILTEFEACLGVGRSETVKGLSVVQKDVILYGGEGNYVTFTSSENGSFCAPWSMNNRKSNAPIASVDTVEPIVLGTKIVDCNCPCSVNEYVDFPEGICDCLGGNVIVNTNSSRLYISLGIFSIIKITRPAQLLISAQDSSVPEKECVPATSDEDPCSLFNAMDFPTQRFRSASHPATPNDRNGRRCGCQNK